jgi:hypothetical protein
MIHKNLYIDSSGCFQIGCQNSFNFGGYVNSFGFTVQMFECCCWEEDKVDTFFYSKAFTDNDL